MTCDALKCKGESPTAEDWTISRGRRGVTRICPTCLELARRPGGVYIGPGWTRRLKVKDKIDY